MTDDTRSPPRWQQAESDPARIILSGQWTLAHAVAISEQLREIPSPISSVDASGIARLDSAGVMQLIRFAGRRGLDGEHLQFNPEHAALVQVIEDVADDRPKRRREYGFAAALERLGRATHDVVRDIVQLVGFTGENLSKMARMVREPRRFRLTATVYHMEQVGLDAVPLVMLLSFMVGAVIAFLGATVLRDFGAEVFVVDLVSISFLREFAVLMTAIVLAGRTASAFTAQIGAMQSGEEIDAIRTLGLDPIELLVLPRLFALLLMLPLLTFIAMLAGLLGGMVVAAAALDISPEMYLVRLHETVELRHFIVGLSKAPLFAVVISMVGCLEGFQVQGTAQSVGERTTSSVVQAISLVILLDAFAALFFMEMDW
jgi:phospholipid/cholesterol/gamma-HCH transport system permease protein